MRADVFTGLVSAGHGSPNLNQDNQAHGGRFVKNRKVRRIKEDFHK